MKKILLFLSIMLTLGVVTNSCISEKIDEIVPPPDPDPDPDPTPGTKKTYYIRFLPDPYMTNGTVDTYASPYIAGGNTMLIWGASETIGMFVTGSDGVSLETNKKFDYTQAVSIYTDTTTSSLRTASAYGYTPYQASISGRTVSYTLNNVQNQSTNNSVESNMDDALAGNVFTISSPSSVFDLDGGTCAMTFNSVFAFLRFQVRSVPTVFSFQRIKGVELYIADTTTIEKPIDSYALAGNYTIDVSKAPGELEYSGPVFTSGYSHSKIRSSVTGDVLITATSESPYVWFVINPLKIKPSERLISIVETTSGYKIISKHDISKLQPNAVYTSIIEATKDNTISSSIIEISGGKPSNCNIASSAATYRLYTKTISGASLTGTSVEWLWASKEGGGSFQINELIDPATVQYNSTMGYVDFRVGTELGKFTKGNVILALKNASNEIVWTWHIWITDKPQDVNYEGNKEFIDRNIGALSANMVSTGIDNYGFVYQWGRKDPFFGGDGITNETTANMLSIARNNTIVNTGASWSVNTTTGTIDMATKNPMKFICNNSTSKDEPADWLSVSNSTLWSATVKTDYDPCPYGYKVPSKDDLKSLHDAPQNDLWYFNYQGHRYWDYYYYQGEILTAWPAAGMRQGRTSFNGNNGAQLLYSGTDADDGKCIYWTSSPINIDGSMLSGGSHRIYTSGNKLYSEDDYGDNADAYPVRCVKMANP